MNAPELTGGKSNDAGPTSGDVIDGRYELRRELGGDASARLFEARHAFTWRRVTVKLVVPQGSPNRAVELRARLTREARALSAVRHPGVVEVLDGGLLDDGSAYLATDRLEGRTLEGLLATRGRLSMEDTVAVALQLADALDAIHESGVVHRNVRPESLVITRDRDGRERLKLVEFGFARVPAAEEDERVTAVGSLIGTPEYMAPEQLRGESDVDGRADIYALGIILFECLTGAPPYQGTYRRVLLDACSSGPLPTIPGDVCTPDLAAVVKRAMAREREARFATGFDVAAAIRAIAPAARERTTVMGPPPLPRSARKPADSSVVQRRRSPRAPYSAPLRVELPDGSFIDGRTEDISEGGLLAICRTGCEASGDVGLRFALPVEGLIVACKAVLRWVRSARQDVPNGPCAMGLEFVDPPPELQASIARYVELMGDDRLT